MICKGPIGLPGDPGVAGPPGPPVSSYFPIYIVKSFLFAGKSIEAFEYSRKTKRLITFLKQSEITRLSLQCSGGGSLLQNKTF